MTLCPNGSTVNPSAAPFRWITWVDAQSWLGTFFAKFSWLSFLMQPALVQVSTFCASEPTQPVYPGDATVVAAATNPQAFDSIIKYLRDSAIWFAWSQVCQCNASGSPGCIGPLYSHTSNLASGNTGSNRETHVLVQMTTGGLTLWGINFDAQSSETVTAFWLDLSASTNFFQNATVVPGWNTIGFTTPLVLANTHQYRIGIRTNGSGGTFDMWINATQTHNYSSGANILGWEFGPWDFSTINPSTAEFGIDPIICVSSPIAYTPSPPPAPATSLPDVPVSSCSTAADLCTLVNPLIDQVALLKQRLDLIQRRLLPFAWIAGTTSSGLSGAGSIAVTDCLGCIVELTTVPIGWGSTVETPRRLIPSAGSLQGKNSSNFDDNRQVHYEHELVLFGDPWATSIQYNFKLGIVASITPIFPEP